MPRTLVTNSPDAVTRFAAASVDGVVLKPLSTNLIWEDHTYKMGWTRRALHRGDASVVHGQFLPWWGCFMRRRTTTGPSTGTPPPTRTTQPPTTRHTPLNPAELDGGARFPLLAQLHLPSGMFHSIRPADDQAPVSYLAAPDGSWCEITRTPDATGNYPLREAGPTLLWAAIETAWTQWTELGGPAWHEFGLTATSTTHHIWHRDPNTGPHWALPTQRMTMGSPP